MSTSNRSPDLNYPDPDVPPRLREVPRRPPQTRRTARWLIAAAILLGVIVLVGIALFIARQGGGAPAQHNAPKAPTSMFIASAVSS